MKYPFRFLFPVISFVLVALAGTLPAHASDDITFDDNDIPSVFFVAKSQNQNQVPYGVQLDERCRSTGHRPVVSYWRMLEEGRGIFEPLTKRERSYFGIAWQDPEPRSEGGTIELAVRGLKRHLRIVVESTEKGCRARALTRIGAAAAVLDKVWAQIGFFRLSYVDLIGHLLDGERVRERIDR